MPDIYVNGLLRELDRGEKELVLANVHLKDAQLTWDVAAIKYGAIRDEAFAIMGGDPYRVGEWPDAREDRGQFRYVRADHGWAVVEVLMQAEEPLPSQTIMRRLSHGGLRPVDMRAINAVLQGSNKIERVEPTEDGQAVRYQIVEVTHQEPNDLPF